MSNFQSRQVTRRAILARHLAATRKDPPPSPSSPAPIPSRRAATERPRSGLVLVLMAQAAAILRTLLIADLSNRNLPSSSSFSLLLETERYRMIHILRSFRRTGPAKGWKCLVRDPVGKTGGQARTKAGPAKSKVATKSDVQTSEKAETL